MPTNPDLHHGLLSSGIVYLDQTATVDAVTLGVGAAGTLNVNSGKNLTMVQGISVGDLPGGTGTLNISNGTVTDQSIGYVGAFAGTSGVINVSSAGASFVNSGTLYFGDYGSAQMTISGGGSVSTGTTYMAFQPGSSGSVTVSGTGSQWNNSGNLFIGSSGVGSLTINGGGAVNNGPGNFITGVDLSNWGQISVNHGDLSVQGVVNNGPGATLTISSSTASFGALVNLGYLGVTNTSSLSISGNVDDSFSLFTGTFGTGGNTITIGGTLKIDPSGGFFVNRPADSANIGILANNGVVSVDNGATLNLTNQPNGITDVTATSIYSIYGSFTAGGKSAFASLQTVDGTLQLYGGQSVTATPQNGILTIGNSGTLLVSDPGTALNVSGDLVNNGVVEADYYSNLVVTGSFTNSNNNAGGFFITSGAQVQIAGNFDNQGAVISYSSPGVSLTVAGTLTNEALAGISITGADSVFIGNLVNDGYLKLFPGATLNLTNQLSGITDVVAGSTFDLAGTFNAGANNGFYLLTSVEGNLLLENGQTTTSTPIGGTFTVGSTGFVEVVSGTTFNINGNVVVDPGGIFSVNDPLPTTVNISGMLTNNGGQVNVVGPTAFLNVGGIGNGGTLVLPEGSTVSLANGFYQLAQGTLGETIGAMGFSVLAVNGGLVMLDGTLDVLLDAGFNPAIGTTYQFLTFNPGALSGQFASIQNDIFNGGIEKWVLVYNNAGGYVELEAQATPEPSSLLLLGTGLLGIAFGVRRRLSR